MTRWENRVHQFKVLVGRAIIKLMLEPYTR
jgi:hypothetical protein